MLFILCVSFISIVCGPFFNSVDEKQRMNETTQDAIKVHNPEVGSP